MINAEQLQQLNQQELTEYIRRRLRLEVFDPPRNERFGVEPPEQFILDSCRRLNDRLFRDRVIEAIHSNLINLIQLQAVGDLDKQDKEHMASLAFLAAELSARKLAKHLYALASSVFLTDETAKTIGESAFFHLLRQVARVQDGPELVPFWIGLCSNVSPSIRTIAWYGLLKADSDQVLKNLSKLADDTGLELAPILWEYATAAPGIRALGETSLQLEIKQQARLRAALEEAGIDSKLLLEFDMPYEYKASMFNFPPNVFPSNPIAARKRPRWETQYEVAA